MPAPKGHEMWGNPIKPKTYTPEEFWDKAVEYFEWCKANPWLKHEAIKSGQNCGELVQVPCERPYSIGGLCVFANISQVTFLNYSTKEGYETYFTICSHIKDIIDKQHFEGGMIGAYNANIVTRKLGLKENIDTTTNGKEITQPQQMSDELISKLIDKL